MFVSVFINELLYYTQDYHVTFTPALQSSRRWSVVMTLVY